MSRTVQQASPKTAPSLRRTETIFIQNLSVEAQVGVYDHERGRHQRLCLEIEAQAEVRPADGLAGTVDYDFLARAALTAAAASHYDLIESFAEAVAGLCLTAPRIRRLRVSVAKPEALSRYDALAGFELLLDRTEVSLEPDFETQNPGRALRLAASATGQTCAAFTTHEKEDARP